MIMETAIWNKLAETAANGGGKRLESPSPQISFMTTIIFIVFCDFASQNVIFYSSNELVNGLEDFR